MAVTRGIEDFTPHDDDRFVESVRRLRERNGWSQGELARRIQAAGVEGFHQTTVSRIEKGERPVRLGEARALARILGTSVERMVAPDMREGRITVVEDAFEVLHEDADKIKSLIREMAWHEHRLRASAESLRQVNDWTDPHLAKRAAEQLSHAKSHFETSLEDQLHDLIATTFREERNKHHGFDQEAP